jgi:hypothetical protein
MWTFPLAKRLFLMELALVLSAGPALAQPRPAAPGAQDLETAAPPTGRSQRLSELLKSEVILSSGSPAGEVTDLIIGPTGQVDYVVASTADGLYAIPFDAAVLDPAQHRIRVPLTAAEFRSMLFFTVRTWPDFDDRDYRLRLAKTFGLTEAPRLSRRVPPSSDTVPLEPGVRTLDPVKAIGNTAVPPGRTHGIPLPGATETGVRGRGKATGTGAAAIGGAGAAGAPGGAVTGAKKPVPSGPQVPQKP